MWACVHLCFKRVERENKEQRERERERENREHTHTHRERERRGTSRSQIWRPFSSVSAISYQLKAIKEQNMSTGGTEHSAVGTGNAT